MTEYVIDDERRAVIAVWRGTCGRRATTVAELPSSAETEAGCHLATMLTDLSRDAWARYAHPFGLNSEGRTTGLDDPGGTERTTDPGGTGDTGDTGGTVSDVLDALRSPGSPRFLKGGLAISEGLVEDHAHWIGWALRAVGDPALAAQITAEARLELDAVERAGKGDLTGRAEQAVHLDRTQVSPVQVAAADHLLAEDPLGGIGMFADIDPAAAAVAAAHWLSCAATVAGEECGIDVEDVVVEAGRLEPVPHELPTLVLTRLGSGRRSRDVVLELIRDALLVRDGRLPSLADLQYEVAGRLTVLERHAGCHPSVGLALTTLRITPLDPARPARSLLCALLQGLKACATLVTHHLAEECTDDESDPDDPDGEPAWSEQESLTLMWVEATRREVRRSCYRLF